MRLSSALPCLALLLGCAAPRDTTPEPAVQAAARAPSAPAKLPPYEVLESTVSPDGTSWCIQNVRLEERVPGRTLRLIWESLRKQQPLEWRRFTCRFHLPDQSSWADVNEVTIFETPRRAEDSPDVATDEEEPVVVEIGEDYVVYDFMGVAIRWVILDDLDAPYVWIRDPRTGECQRVPVADLPRLPPCASALTR